MTDATDSSRAFVLVGNLTAIDLVNTRPLRHGEPEELLNTFGDVVAWLEASGVIGSAEARGALRKWDAGAEGRRVLESARTLREHLRGAIEKLAAGSAPGNAVVRDLNAILKTRPVHGELVGQGQDFRLQQVPSSEQAMHLLVPVAESAAWLLAEGDRDLLRKCEDPACILYFYDTTRNKRRRWCSMDGCGARAKAAAYYARERRKKG